MKEPFDLETEVRHLCACRDIKDALCRYMRGQDRLDAELHRSAFHDDAWIDCGVMKGSADEFVTFSQNFLRGLKATQHIMGQVQLDIEGDHASGEVYFYAWHRTGEDTSNRTESDRINQTEDAPPHDLFMAGRYIDEYACREGDWRIIKRLELIDWARNDPATDGFMQGFPDLLKGIRGKSDFSYTRNWPME